MFESIGGWLEDHAGEIGNVLGDISAVTGLLALMTPPPFDAIALGISVGLTLAANIDKGAAGIGAFLGGRISP